MDFHNRRLDRVMYLNPVDRDWYMPVQEWTCPRCQKNCTNKHCPRCPNISCPLHKSFMLRNTEIPYNKNHMNPCPYCGMFGCQCSLNNFSRQVCDRYRRMRELRQMSERREGMTQFFIFLMIVFFVVIFMTCTFQTK